MKQKLHKKVRSSLLRALFRTLQFFLNITVFLLGVNKNQDHPTTRELMAKLIKQDPSLLDSKPSHNRHFYER